MPITWNDRDPIYRQLHDWLCELILDGVVADGDALPSVRQVAAEQRINPITVSKAFQLLVDEALVEKRRGLGMFVAEGGRERLLERERVRFLSDEWPVVVRTIDRLGLSVETLLSEQQP